MRTIEWNSENKTIQMVDQTLLPQEYRTIECTTIESLCRAIITLKVRGAPAIGAAGAYGIALAAQTRIAETPEELLRELESAARKINSTRPTAINLSWATDRVMKTVTSKTGTKREILETALEEAEAIADEDIRTNKKIGEHGATLLQTGDTVLTHCNAGRLACVDWGTALGVIRSAINNGKEIQIIACETRPLNQGSRLTTWELSEDKIPVTLITDSTAGHLMRRGKIDKIIVGADRITEDAVFNKIGTYTHSVLAKEHKIPFYVAAPTSTIDRNHHEKDITIEERDPDELRYLNNIQLAPNNIPVYNPAFDATPIENITAIITEKGILHPPLTF
ncbi:S-methyl-5-thioribose-1-phosphate isomerase [Methanosarcinales archaeon]|nr:MAG: S-methyl-5-thioribose-1-phosphate isomerase [Methanosarcinales archaeon]